MKNGRMVASRYAMSLVVSVMCLMMASCSGSKPIEVSDNDQSRFDETTKELRKKAQGGDASAQNELGLLYYEGRGVGQNYRKAKEWFDKAVEQGHTGAQVNLGTLYLRGEGAPQSSQMALFWFTRAAGQEDALALAKLGLMYSQGRGALQDFIQAHMWYNLSAARGEARFINFARTLLRVLFPDAAPPRICVRSRFESLRLHISQRNNACGMTQVHLEVRCKLHRKWGYDQ